VTILSRVSGSRRGFALDIEFTHDSEPQAITAPSLISVIYNSLQHPLSLLQHAVFPDRSLEAASDSVNSSASRLSPLFTDSSTELNKRRSRSLLPARSILASATAGTHGHIFVQCQDRSFSPFCWSSLLSKEVLVSFLYRLVFTHYTLLHRRSHTSLSPRDCVEYVYIYIIYMCI
jgi:hypothetical protein